MTPSARRHRPTGTAPFGPASAPPLPGVLPRTRIGRILGRVRFRLEVPEAERRSGPRWGGASTATVAAAAAAIAKVWRHSRPFSLERSVRLPHVPAVPTVPAEHRVRIALGAGASGGIEEVSRAVRLGAVVWHSTEWRVGRGRVGVA